jgi:hypothetical protein
MEDNGFKLNSEGGTLKGLLVAPLYLFHPDYVKVDSGSLFILCNMCGDTTYNFDLAYSAEICSAFSLGALQITLVSDDIKF